MKVVTASENSPTSLKYSSLIGLVVLNSSSCNSRSGQAGCLQRYGRILKEACCTSQYVIGDVPDFEALIDQLFHRLCFDDSHFKEMERDLCFSLYGDIDWFAVDTSGC